MKPKERKLFSKCSYWKNRRNWTKYELIQRIHWRTTEVLNSEELGKKSLKQLNDINNALIRKSKFYNSLKNSDYGQIK